MSSVTIQSRRGRNIRGSLWPLSVCCVAAAVVTLLQVFRPYGFSYSWLFLVPGMYAAWALRDQSAWIFWLALVMVATIIKLAKAAVLGMLFRDALEHAGGVLIASAMVYLVWDRRRVTNSLSRVSHRFRRRLARRTFHLRQASHKFHQVVLESLPDAVLVCTNDRVAFCNEALARLVGASSATSLLGARAERLLPSGRLTAMARGLAQDAKGPDAKESGKCSAEEMLTNLSGEAIPVNVNATAIRFRGTPSTLLVLRDLRRRKAAEEAQRRSEEHLRLAMATAPIGTWEWNARTGEVVWSESLWKMFGRTPFSEPLRFGSFLREVHEEDQGKLRLEFQQALERDIPYYVEIRLVKPDGSLRWAVEHGQILRDADGQVVRMVGVTMDITESKKMAEEIRRVSEFREAVISKAAEGICVCHAIPEFPHVRFSVWNERMREITGYPLEEINRLGSYQSMLPDPVLQARAIERMARMWAGDDLREEEWTITTKDGTERMVAITTSALRGGAESGSVVALLHDVTEKRRAEEVIAAQRAELLHCSRLSTLGQMASTLSHEVAQPLNAIANYAGAGMAILDRRDPLELEKLSSYLQEIMDQSQRTNDIMRQMCRYGRKSPTTQSTSNLNSVACDALRLLSLELRRHDIHVEVRLAEESIWARIERVQLEQVIVNLLTNSMEAFSGSNRGDRRIVVTTQAWREWAFLEVEDFGPGVPASIRGRLFESFITTKDEGSGIGLSICREILREQGGDIQYIDPDHSGALFQIRLPRVSPEPTA